MGKKRVSWLNPDKIERQSIVNSLILSKRYAKGKLCDIGCGRKPYKYIFSDVIDEHIGIDLPSPKWASEEDKAIDIYASMLSLPFKSESFDTILCTQVIEHIPDPDTAFREMNRVLKKGGVLILTAPQTWGLHDQPYDFYRYTKYGLEYLAKKNGFNVEYINPRGGALAAIGQLLSSFIFYSLGVKRIHTTRSPILKAPVCIICAVTQMIFTLLDRILSAHDNTLGYIIVAMK